MTLNQRDQFFSHCHGHPQKPMEIYMFVDPLSPECWALEPAIKKLKIRYGRFFTLRIIAVCSITALNVQKRKKHLLAEAWEKIASKSGMSCDGTLWLENPLSAPYLASLALKAAELQGRKAGLQFLRSMQERLFLSKQDITDEEVLFNIAESTQLDAEEFKKDLHSQSAVKALQCDMKIAAEMEVTSVPTLTFFNSVREGEGLKVTGHYSYDIYEEVLFEMLGDEPKPSQTPPLEIFVEYFQFVADKEIAVVYDWTLEQVEREMKKLAFAGKVKRVEAKHGMFWRFVNEDAGAGPLCK
ncbi:dithiol-disulfide isomerase [Bacillus glycinifermentans]|uniref:ClpXP adapter protein SpxH n=2 Tax=Bacillus glycinifermentans TaxID=1664069 RepID=A0A0J6EWF9_9BACI|nr:protease adaptor protein SpxH [Bacillus glycinifermentans]ATH95073.1 DsbA family protein [Bacillus glycinifermentans]KMM61993.1 dithiol-disulfide isomerase [Bacillus glycinifermentans]KRT93264.1 dithiol-disulfide isomerase [Bacillus glycinifermentans]MEC0487552.1 protease adaptor protein SpxH [Bacillus glycinifermentans]MEC0495842.1 protease adaptor protein SpxH [Bacillus glycinifermentans]